MKLASILIVAALAMSRAQSDALFAMSGSWHGMAWHGMAWHVKGNLSVGLSLHSGAFRGLSPHE